MKEEMRNNKKFRNIAVLLLLASACAALKCIFVGLQVDEEYAVSMPYRMLRGDKMFAQIWDPHQTSAFCNQFLIWIYRSIFHTTDGVVIWIRFWGTMIHGAIAYQVYWGLRNYLSAEYSFYLGILYFNLLPKGFIMPEFSNLLVWSLTLVLISLSRLEKKRNPIWAVESGIWMCTMVLAYPSAVILFPFFLWYLWKQKEYGKKAACIFAAVCLVSGLAYLGYLLSYMSPAVFLENIQYFMVANSGHTSNTVAGRLKVYFREAGYAVCISVVYVALAGVMELLLKKIRKTANWYQERTKEEKWILRMYLILLFGGAHQVIHWLLALPMYELSYIYTVYFILIGMVFCFVGKVDETVRKTVKLWVGSSVLMLLAVLMLTDLSIFTSVRYVSPAVVMGLMFLLHYSEKAAPKVYRKLGKILVLFWCFAAIFIKGWEYRDNDGKMENITCVRGIVSEGPAKGLFTQYMLSNMQESLYEEMHTYVQPGDKMILVDLGTIGYLSQDVEIASYITICEPYYSEVLLTYWELNPEKYPTVIAIPCWFGELRWDMDSWIMQWIEKEYNAQQVIDGAYYRYYIKR